MIGAMTQGPTGRVPRALRFAAMMLIATILPGLAGASARAVHYQTAQIAVAVTHAFVYPQRVVAAAPILMRVGALPHVAMRTPGNDPTIIRTWYRFTYAAAVSREAVYLYVPRWQVTGKLAVYADRKLIYAPRSGPKWMSFNTPIWLKIADAGTPPPQETLIIIDSLKSNGGGLSTVWIGDESALAARHAARSWLQVTVTSIVSYAGAICAMIGLAVWIGWRRDPAFLWLAAATVFDIVWEMQFRTGEEPHWVSEAWFGWLATCALQWWVFTAYLFSLRIIRARFRLMTGALTAFTVLFTVLTLPTAGPGGALVSPTFAPLMDAVTLASVALITGGLWFAYARNRSHEGLAMCLFITIGPLAGYHDVLLHQYRISLESLYWAPIATSALLFAMIYVMLRRYILAMREGEQYALRLETRVREREAELETSHARLRDIERRETVAAERQRLMRDMHDGMGSSLMGALAAVERGRLNDLDIAQVLRECLDDLKLTIDSLETVEADLPLVLATLRYRLGPRFEQAGIALVWRVGQTPPLAWLDSECAMQILRMVQEMFTNIVKHARASQVIVTTGIDGADVVLVVQDNGVGFPAPAPSFDSAPGPGGRGLLNLKQRAGSIGATIVWTSSSGGVRFELRLPLTRESSAK